MSCSSTCTSPKVSLSGSKVSNLTFCRTLDFYVDPTSTEILELGTKKYPYKSIMLLFIEILNFYSNTNANINIYVYERSRLEILTNYIYLIGLGNVTISSYSDVSSTPSKFYIVVKNTEANATSVKTRFTLLSNFTINLSNFTSNSSISTTEKSLLSTNNVAIVVARSSLTMSGVEISTNYTDSTLSYTLMMSSNTNETNSILLYDINLKTNKIFRTTDPINFTIRNADIDFYDMRYGFYFLITCNNTGDMTTATISFDNITVYNSQDRVKEMTSPFIYINSAYNFSLTNSFFSIYSTELSLYDLVELASSEL